MISGLCFNCRGLDSAGRTMIRPPERPLPTKSLASPSRFSVKPVGIKAPKELPAEPFRCTLMVSAGSPFAPAARGDARAHHGAHRAVAVGDCIVQINRGLFTRCHPGGGVGGGLGRGGIDSQLCIGDDLII